VIEQLPFALSPFHPFTPSSKHNLSLKKYSLSLLYTAQHIFFSNS
jgi:hypothetical protein